jgi:hypothetical protein
MESLTTAAARALAAGDLLGVLKRVGLRDDAPALALRGIAMAQLGDLVRVKALLRSAAQAFGPNMLVGAAPAASRKGWRPPLLLKQSSCSSCSVMPSRKRAAARSTKGTIHEFDTTKMERRRAAASGPSTAERRQREAALRAIPGARSRSSALGRRDRDGELLPAHGTLLPRSEG